jgi:hypothetical protein
MRRLRGSLLGAFWNPDTDRATVRAIRSTTELNGEASSRGMYRGHCLRILTLPKNGRFIRENSRFLLPHNSGRSLKSSNP